MRNKNGRHESVYHFCLNLRSDILELAVYLGLVEVVIYLAVDYRFFAKGKV